MKNWLVCTTPQLTFNCDSNSLRCPPSSGLAVTTSQTTSPRCADMINLNALMTVSSLFMRPFSASCSKKNPVAGAYLTWLDASLKAVAFKLRLMVGLISKSRNFWSFLTVAWKPIKSFSTASRVFCLEAAEKSAHA